MTLAILSRKIELTATVDDWELFDMPGADAAVEHINKTIVEAVGAGDSRSDVYRKAYAVMKQYANLGACDSEPMYYLEDILDKVFGDAR